MYCDMFHWRPQNPTVHSPDLALLGQAVEVMKRVSNGLDAAKILDVVMSYSAALDLLDGHDHRTVGEPSAKTWSPNETV